MERTLHDGQENINGAIMKHEHTFTNFMAATRLCKSGTSHTPERHVRTNVTLRSVRLTTVGVEKQ